MSSTPAPAYSPATTDSSNSPLPTVAVFGAGLIGTYLGLSLSLLNTPTDPPIHLIGRSRLLEKHSRLYPSTETDTGPGFRLTFKRTPTSPSLTTRIPRHAIRCHSSLQSLITNNPAPDFLVITLKRFDNDAAVDALKQAGFTVSARQQGWTPTGITHDPSKWYWRNTTIIMFQNGAGAASMLREALGDFERTLDVVDGMWYFNVVEHEEGDVQQGSFGPLCVPDTEKGRWFKETLLNAGTECRVEKDMDSMVYGKLIMNLNNAINALSGLPLKREFLDYQYRHALALTQREAFKVLKAHQIEPISSTAVPAHLIPDFLLLPDTVFKGVMGKVFAVNDKGTSSMYEDLKAHRRTEIDFFQGEISRLGKIHGILTPLCDRAVELVKGLEERRAGIVRHSGEEMFGEGF